MTHPKIKDPEVQQYVDELLRKIENFSSDTTLVKSYFALKRFIDENNKLVTELEMDTMNLTEKDDKLHDRVTKYMDNIIEFNKNLSEMEKMINPEVMEAERKKESAGKFEKAMNGKQ